MFGLVDAVVVKVNNHIRVAEPSDVFLQMNIGSAAVMLAVALGK
jgi:hypothetical protein